MSQTLNTLKFCAQNFLEYIYIMGIYRLLKFFKKFYNIIIFKFFSNKF